MSARLHDGTLATGLRGGLCGLAAAVVALLVFAFVGFGALGTAGADWQTGAGKATLVLSLGVLFFLALAVGGAVGTWQAAAAGARSRREAMLAGAAVPAVAALIFSVALSRPSAGGLAGGLAGGVVMAAGAVFGAWMLGRRLDGHAG